MGTGKILENTLNFIYQDPEDVYSKIFSAINDRARSGLIVLNKTL